VVFKLLIMFSWLNKDDRRKGEPEVYATVAEGLRKLYQQVHNICFACFVQIAILLSYPVNEFLLPLMLTDLSSEVLFY